MIDVIDAMQCLVPQVNSCRFLRRVNQGGKPQRLVGTSWEKDAPFSALVGKPFQYYIYMIIYIKPIYITLDKNTRKKYKGLRNG